MNYNPPIEEKRDCANPNCNKTFSGRKNKKFCNVRCKALHNIKGVSSKLTAPIDTRVHDTRTEILDNGDVRQLQDDNTNPSDVQIGGSHYKDFPIQPYEYCHKNKLGMLESNVIKYVSRHKTKNKEQDIRKAIHTLELLLEIEYNVNK
jgi:hypothetical protein